MNESTTAKIFIFILMCLVTTLRVAEQRPKKITQAQIESVPSIRPIDSEVSLTYDVHEINGHRSLLD